MSWQWVADDAALAALCASLQAHDAIAIDTEFRRRDTFYPQVALVQIAVPGACWLIDPLPLTDIAPLRDLLCDNGVIKVLHSASEDLEVFEHWLGVLPTPLFDSQKAAAMLGMGFGLGYRSLVQAMLGVELAKDETQSDWLARPLSDAQCTYAAQDVEYLMACWPTLRDKANSTDRLAWILQEGAAMSTGGRGPLAKFKSAWKLPPASQAALLALVEWRERQARERDKPRTWILKDKAILELAQRMPASQTQLSRIADIPAGVIRRQGAVLLDLIEQARSGKLPTPALPTPTSAEARRLARDLSASLEAAADELGMNPEALLANRDLELIASQALGEGGDSPDTWSGWRAPVVERLRQRAHALVEAS